MQKLLSLFLLAEDINLLKKQTMLKSTTETVTLAYQRTNLMAISEWKCLREGKSTEDKALLTEKNSWKRESNLTILILQSDLMKTIRNQIGWSAALTSKPKAKLSLKRNSKYREMKKLITQVTEFIPTSTNSPVARGHHHQKDQKMCPSSLELSSTGTNITTPLTSEWWIIQITETSSTQM
jgi:hypothetical protein